jgi:predicted DNA-binding transcriptional regulator YafY
MAMKDKRLEKKFVRLLRMIDYINNNLALDSDEIAEYLGVCKRTVFRYLEDLKSVDDITVTLDNTRGI